MLFWRIWAALLGSSLIIGETIRSWGQGRNLLFVIDDYFIGVPLILAAVLMSKPTVRNYVVFGAAFAAAAGMLYGSFFGKLIDPDRPMASNMEAGLLTLLVGMAFFSSIAGLIGSLVLASRESR